MHTELRCCGVLYSQFGKSCATWAAGQPARPRHAQAARRPSPVAMDAPPPFSSGKDTRYPFEVTVLQQVIYSLVGG